MAYGIMRIEKRNRQAVGGLEAEANRTEADRDRKHFDGSDIDWNRTHENVRLISSDKWINDINNEIEQAGVKRVRKDAVVMLDAVYTASPDFFEGKSREDITKYFCHCLAYHQSEYGHIVNAVIHFDETTPHMHVCSVPLTKDGRLSAKEIMGNKSAYHKRQDRFFALVSKEYGLERGMVREYGQERKHIEQMEWKTEQARKRYMRSQEVEAVEIKKPLIGKNIKVNYKEQERLVASAKHFDKAVEVFHNRAAIIKQAERQADNIVKQAESTLTSAKTQARQIVQEAEQDAERIRRDAYREKVPELTALTNENRELKRQVNQFNDFLAENNLLALFREFLDRVAEKVRSLGRGR